MREPLPRAAGCYGAAGAVPSAALSAAARSASRYGLVITPQKPCSAKFAITGSLE